MLIWGRSDAPPEEDSPYPPPFRVLGETLLHTVPDSRFSHMTFSSGVSYAYAVPLTETSPERWAVVANAQRLPSVDRVGFVGFDPGGRVVYGFSRGGKEGIAVEGGEPLPLFDDIGVRWDPDLGELTDGVEFDVRGNQVLIARRGGLFWVAQGESLGYHFEKILRVVLSPDRKNVAWVASRRRREFVVLNGGALPGEYDEVEDAQFLPDGRSVALIVRYGDRRQVVHGSFASPSYDHVKALYVAPDGRLAYIAWNDALPGSDLRECVVVLQDTVVRTYRAPFCKSNVRFLSDGRLVYVVAEGSEPVAAEEGVEEGTEEPEEPPEPDEETAVEYVVVRDQAGRRYDSINEYSVTASPDGSLVVYLARREGRHWVVVNDRELGPYRGARWVVLNDQGDRFACAVRDDRGWYLLQGDVQGKTLEDLGRYENLGFLGFGPSGELLAVAQEGRTAFLLFGDRRGPSFDRVVGRTSHSFSYCPPPFRRVSKACFSEDGRRYYYNAVRGNGLYRVAEEVPEKEGN